MMSSVTPPPSTAPHLTGVLRSLDETKLLGEALAIVLRGGMTLALTGGLAAGKTTLSRSIAQALGAVVPVSSPTFVLCHEYPLANAVTLEHWDLYRLRGAPEELGDEPAADTIRLIEWCDRAPEVLQRAHLAVSFALQSETARTFTISTERTDLLDSLSACLSTRGLEHSHA